MNKPSIPSRILAILVGTAAVLTITLVVLLLSGHLFGKMGDATAQTVLDHTSTAIALLWLIDLICLIFALGINSLGGD